MWPRLQWIIGLIGLAVVGLTSGQKPEVPAEDASSNDTSTKPPLTGIPQLDYIHDPNLPHELKGYDLSNYPFYSLLPKDLLDPSFNFTCEGRYDGFYASVPHRCQVYHNCLFSQRYDFLCANYTVFDQKNFICHYVSEVDCANSANHYDRNEELYKTTTTTTSTHAPPKVIFVERPRPLRGQGLIRPRPRPFGGNARRPGNRRTTTTPAPVYYDDYYYDYYDQYYDDYYNDYANDPTSTTTTTTQRPRRPNRPQRTRLGDGQSRPGRFGNIFNVNNRKRPSVNPPVPVGEERPRSSRLQQGTPARQQAIKDAPVNESPQDKDQNASSGPRRRRPGRKPRPGARPKKITTTTSTTTEAVPEDYYDYYYDYADESASSTTTTTSAPARSSRPNFNRNRSGSSQRGQQNRPTSTTTTTTTEASRGRVTRPSRVNVRKNPFNSRTTPVDGAVPVDTAEGTPAPQRQQPSRLRPQFPRKRPQSTPSDAEKTTEIIEEDPPLAPGLELTPDGAPVDTAGAGSEVRSRGPIRRVGQGGPRPGQRLRGQQRRTTPAPDYYDY